MTPCKKCMVREKEACKTTEISSLLCHLYTYAAGVVQYGVSDVVRPPSQQSPPAALTVMACSHGVMTCRRTSHCSVRVVLRLLTPSTELAVLALYLYRYASPGVYWNLAGSGKQRKWRAVVQRGPLLRGVTLTVLPR